MERRFMEWCDSNDKCYKWSSEEVVIPYISPIDNKQHRYFPDFLIQTPKGWFLIEVKPLTQSRPPKKLVVENLELKKKRRVLLEYYLGELDQEELKELGREPFYKKLLKNEVDLYIDSDNSLTEQSLRVSVQEEKVNYLEAVLRQINNRGFQIKNAIDWNRFITG